MCQCTNAGQSTNSVTINVGIADTGVARRKRPSGATDHSVGHFEHVFSEALGGKTVAGVIRPTVTAQIGQDHS